MTTFYSRRTGSFAHPISVASKSRQPRLTLGIAGCLKITTLALLCFTAATAMAQTPTTLPSFTGPDGASPKSPLVQGFDGHF